MIDSQTLQDCYAANQRISQLFMALGQRNLSTLLDPEPWSDPQGIAMAFSDWSQKLWQNPWQCLSPWSSLTADSHRLLTYFLLRCAGDSPPPVISPQQGDRRFTADEWQDLIGYDLIKQAYLLFSEALQKTYHCELGQEEDHAKKIRFYGQQFLDAIAPVNFFASNPQVLDEAITTQGQSLLNGYINFLEDLNDNWGKWQVRSTNREAFEVGRNVASTPGKVVYQNELMQLLQYQPQTAQVYQRPLLIVPPWINKFYILDLRKSNSFIRWAVSQGHTVFVISWLNPDADAPNFGFDDYLKLGLLAALDAVEQATAEQQVNAMGYCLGGTLLACGNAYLAAKKQQRIVSSTYFTSLLDFSCPGDIGVYIDQWQVQQLEKHMDKTGYLDGSEMAAAFSSLRANDLIWPFFINSYLLGKKPAPFDLLYWNSDATRLPAAMHQFYLNNMYLHNRLRKPGGIRLDGVAIDLRKIRSPSYFLATQDDHIAPWQAVYQGSRLMGGDSRFVLGQSGHIAGVINPPAAGKYGYWRNDRPSRSAKAWLNKASLQPGSWWQDWQQWCSQQAGQQVPARQPGDGRLAILEEAPGSYVRAS